MQFRDLPAVGDLLQTQLGEVMIASHGRPLTVAAVRTILKEIREQGKQNKSKAIPDKDSILAEAIARLTSWSTPSLKVVINATGVILHTNLGRAPYSQAAVRAMRAVTEGYSNLEYGLDQGKRGSRQMHTSSLLCQLTGAESASVVNNNASAVLLVLAALAARRRVIVSRTQLVEIGGGFRVPDVMKQSGAKLVEIGTTNRVHIKDYKEALKDPTALVLHAHRSNFRLMGFTEEPELSDLVEAAHSMDAHVIDDLGSGALLKTEQYGLAHEPTVQESLEAGVDLVCFSGDKLLGGPQAGIIVGKADLLEKVNKHPLARALRADKACLAALSATLVHYLKDEVDQEIPIWRMIGMSTTSIKERAETWLNALGTGEVINGKSTVGGGSLPGETLPTYLLALRIHPSKPFLKKLRDSEPPIITRTEAERILFDPRTVLPEQDEALLVSLKQTLRE